VSPGRNIELVAEAPCTRRVFLAKATSCVPFAVDVNKDEEAKSQPPKSGEPKKEKDGDTEESQQSQEQPEQEDEDDEEEDGDEDEDEEDDASEEEDEEDDSGEESDHSYHLSDIDVETIDRIVCCFCFSKVLPF